MKAKRQVVTALTFAAAAALLLLAQNRDAQGTAAAPVEASERVAPGDSAAVAATVDRFHRALERGDSAAVLALLADDALVLESGGVETKEEYRAHHLAADIEFARAVGAERSPLRVEVRGDLAWTAATSSARGEFRDRPINAAGAELVVLRRHADGWQIVAIHWSSRSLRE